MSTSFPIRQVRLPLVLITLLGVLPAAQAEHASHDATKPVLTLSAAKQVMRAAVDYARLHEAPGGAIAIVDDGGHIIIIERLDGTFRAAANISVGKARTAALFQRPTRGFEDLVNKGRTTMVALPDVTPFTPLQGGVPLMIGDTVVGAIGVSGAASAQQDDDIAQAAADAFSKPGQQAATMLWKNGDVAKAFANGAALLETGEFKVHASRRDAPGEAEVHLNETDIFYVLGGSAKFVTGGKLVEPRSLNAHELRAPSIDGGDSQTLVAGDVIVIPKGVPHWFKSVKAPFTYYVVKSID